MSAGRARAAALLWLGASLRRFRAFRAAAEEPDAAQEAIVLGLVRRNEETAFGRAHGFGRVRTLDDFRRRVPVSEPEALAEWTARIAGGETRVLTAEPVDLLVPTSGSTGAPKLVPFTASFRDEVDRAVSPWVAGLFLEDPRLLSGRHYWAVSPVLSRAGRHEGAVPVGFPDDTAYLGPLAARLSSWVQAVPSGVKDVPGLSAFRHVTLRHLLAARDLTLVSVWSPTFLALLLEALPSLAEGLVRDLCDGTLRPPGGLGPGAEGALAAHARKDPLRAAEVERALAGGGGPAAAHARLWPRLRLVSAWADGASARPARALGALLPHARLQPKGLAATEGVTSIPFGEGDAVLAVRSHAVELLPGEGAEPVGPSSAEPGRTYEVVLTTGAGLYRYRTGDLVLVTGRLGRTPRVRFLGRRGPASDLAGEKLDGRLVGVAAEEALAEAELPVRFVLLAPDPGADPPAYVLFVEPAAEAPDARLLAAAEGLERRLAASFHYGYARALGQLGPVRAFRVEGDGREAVLRARHASFARTADGKDELLSADPGWALRLPGRPVPPDPTRVSSRASLRTFL